jgi:hypothetical protein
MSAVRCRVVTALKGVLCSSIIGNALAAFAAPAVASPIFYYIDGTGSGTFDGTSFMNETVLIYMMGDTSNIQTITPTVFRNPGIATLWVGDTFDTLPNVAADVDQMGGVAGFTSAAGANLFLVTNPAFASYTLGLIDDTDGPGIGTSTSFLTGSGGSFTLTSITGDAEFAGTPLPAALPLFATGLGALGLLGWRRKRKARVSLLGVA